MEIHLYFHKWKQFLRITFIWWYWRLKVGVKCIFGGLARLLSCFLLYWPVRIQFCSLEFVVCYLFLWIFLLHSWVIHGWLSLGEVSVLERCLFGIPIRCLLNFVYKLSVGVSIELLVVNINIIFLTSDLRLWKSTFFHMKTSQRWGLRLLVRKLHQLILQYHDLQSQGYANIFLQSLPICY